MLVVDLEQSEPLHAALQQQPEWRVVPVSDGAAALAHLTETSWDVLVLGQFLADMSGLELWAQLQDKGISVATLFIANEETAVGQALAAGVHSYVLRDGKNRYLAYLPQVLQSAYTHWLQESWQATLVHSPTRLPEPGGSILADVLNVASEAVIIIDERMQVIFFNQGAVDLFDYPVKGVLGQPLSLLLPQRFRTVHNLYVNNFANAAETSRPMSQRCRVYARRRDGTEFRAEASIVKLHRNGRLLFAAILRDVTEHEYATESLNQYAKRLEALHEMDQAILAAHSPQEVAQAALSYLRPLVPYQQAGIIAFHPQTATAELLAVAAGRETAVPTEPHTNHRVWHRLAESLAGAAQNAGRTHLELLENALQAEGLHEHVTVPLIVQNQLRGVLSLGTTESGLFDEDHTSIVQEVATPVAMAIQQAQLLETERTQRELAETLRQIAAVLNSTLDRKQVLRTILEQLARVIPYDSASVMLVDGNVVEVVARRDMGKERPSSQLRFESLPHVQYLLENGRPVIISDTAVDERWQSLPNTEYIRCWLGVPLIVKNLVIGLLNLNKERPGYYTQRDADTAVTFADQAALAVENAQLYSRAKHEIDERKQAERALYAERALLAQRVEERTAELTAANARLAQAVRARDEFLASMTHELRTPLNAVLGMAEIMRAELYGPMSDKQHDLLATITDSGHHLLNLINDILDIVRIEAGQIRLDQFPVVVHGVCAQAIELVQPLAQKKEISLKLDVAELTPPVWADELRLQQILVNLLNNAIKFTMSGREVGLTVRSDATNDIILFTVWDTGIGISLDDMRRLFSGANGPTPFMQLDSGLDRHYEGTGLGLSLIYRLTELHGGSVHIKSEVGQGSRFTIALPRRRIAEPEPHTAAKEETDALAFAAGPTILLAEDNAVYIRAVASFLAAHGYQLVLAHNGHEAVRQARNTKPDLIVIDLQMPELGGLQAMQLLREEKELRDVPIIAVTGLVLPGDRERTLSQGATVYLPKPILLSRLLDAVTSLLGGEQ